MPNRTTIPPLPTEFKSQIAYYDRAPDRRAEPTTYFLLHGLGNSLDFWTVVAPELAKARRTVAIDIPGFGRSPAPSSGFSLGTISDAIERFCTAIGLEEAVLVAHSLGAFVAMNIAARQPSIFRRLILVDGTLTRAAELIQHPLRIPFNPTLALYVSAQFVGGLLPINRSTANVVGRSRIMREITLWPFVANPGALDSALVSDALADNGGLAAMRVLARAPSIDYESLMRGVSQPVDLVWGARDHLMNENDVKVARVNMNVVRELAIADCGHWPMIEKPTELTNFLRLADRAI